MPIRLHVYGVWSSGVKRKKLLSVLLSSKMLLVIHQLSVLNRDMFSSGSVYRTYAETSLLARRPLPSSCVELGGTSDSITNISAQETIDIMNIYNFKLEIFNVCMFIIISLWFDIQYNLVKPPPSVQPDFGVITSLAINWVRTENRKSTVWF